MWPSWHDVYYMTWCLLLDMRLQHFDVIESFLCVVGEYYFYTWPWARCSGSSASSQVFNAKGSSDGLWPGSSDGLWPGLRTFPQTTKRQRHEALREMGGARSQFHMARKSPQERGHDTRSKQTSLQDLFLFEKKDIDEKSNWEIYWCFLGFGWAAWWWVLGGAMTRSRWLEIKFLDYYTSTF